MNIKVKCILKKYIKFVAAFVFFTMIFCCLVKKNALGESHLWDREPSLWEAAQKTTAQTKIPDQRPNESGTVNMSNQQMRVLLFGPTERLTLDLRKTDVWDRRISYDPVVTIQDIKKGAFNKLNKEIPGEYSDYEPQRGKLGYLSPNGGRAVAYGQYAYNFPMCKSVGQVIISLPDFEGLDQPEAVLYCKDGTTLVRMKRGKSEANLTYMTMMTENIIAINVDCKNLRSPVFLRLYRHRDTDPWEWDAPWNRPLDPPESGKDGRFFWIRQKMPPEKTFPDGFEYVLMGMISGDTPVIDTIDKKQNLGTKMYSPNEDRDLLLKPGMEHGYQPWHNLQQLDRIRNATGSAATASFDDRKNVNFTALITVVTSNDSDDIISTAKDKLLEAENKGVDVLIIENTAWYRDFYTLREDGRIFDGTPGFAKKQIPGIFKSWVETHFQNCKPDPTRFEADPRYGIIGDTIPWQCLPCYNELFFTHINVLNRQDILEYYPKLVNYWLETCKINARQTFGLPGMFLAHGYLPPIKADNVYPHTINTWEFCMEIPAQVMKIGWDNFDYGGDEKYLKETIYPALRELAIFYAAYAEKHDDGFYHVIPTMSAEHWGWTYQFERNRDSTSALSMFKWTFKRAVEASEILGVDADLRDNWLQIASRMASYPTFESDEGTIFTDVVSLNPIGVGYNWFAGVYPTVLADEINLDSNPEKIEIMLRSARLVKGWNNNRVFHLLGREPDLNLQWNNSREPIIVKNQEDLMNVVYSQPERLLNSRSGRIHLFPCVPEKCTLGFKRLQARGGFAVTAERIHDETTYVLIESRRNELCQLINPWPGSKVILYRNDKKSEELTGSLLKFKTSKGEKIEVRKI